MCFLVQLYIWESILSLKAICTGMQTLIKVLYIRFQAICPFAASSKSNDIAISLALRVTNKRGITT
jgi:hypothetical protein